MRTAVEAVDEEIDPVQTPRRRSDSGALRERGLADAPPACPLVAGLGSPGGGPYASIEPDGGGVEMVRAPMND